MNLDDIPFEIKADPDYYMNVRRFRNGTLEAVVRPVRHMQREQAKQRFENEYFAMRPQKTIDPEVEAAEQAQAEYERHQNHARAVRRAKQTARFLCKEICADRLLTLTYRENMQDRERLYDDFKRFLRLLRKALAGRPWPYVAVPEKQDRGSYHIHLAVKGWQQIKVIRRCWYQALGGRGDETGADTPGQIDVTSPRAKQGRGAASRQWDSSRLAGYIVKYMEKTFDDAAGLEKKRYWHSADAKAPKAERVWLGAVDVTGAITESVSLLRTFYGLVGASWDVWLSEDLTTFWCSGKADVVVSFDDPPPF